ncbi:MAG TPA: acetyl-CoA carboxylase biotin carboxyl carrier protein [Pyrinomonadaceae bacterium]|nr:acetyl-CoA carboxylase biotin carboxyl carrier protein [Pyrinomonadaceae bacterium]
MSEQDSAQPSGHEQTQRERERPQGERGGASGGGGGRHGRRRHPQQQQQQQQSRRTEASINMKELRELIELFTANGLTDFELENEEIRVRLSRNLSGQTSATTGGAEHTANAATPATHSGSASRSVSSPATAAPDRAEAATPGKEEAEEELHVIPSPIVGTFYRSPSPAADPFVKPGSHVEPTTTVCIIEAMKLMNEIQAETTGTVEKIYVENGQPVEYGQPLFGIKK